MVWIMRLSFHVEYTNKPTTFTLIKVDDTTFSAAEQFNSRSTSQSASEEFNTPEQCFNNYQHIGIQFSVTEWFSRESFYMSWVLREGFCRERRVSHFSRRVSTCKSGFEGRVIGSARDNKSGFETYFWASKG